MKWCLIGRISFPFVGLKEFPEIINFLWKYIQSNKWKEVLGDFPEIINFLNTSYQTNERKYSQDFQCKLMISVNSDNQTSFQLFYWNEIREWKLYWKFFHSNFIWFVWLEEFTDFISIFSGNSSDTSFNLIKKNTWKPENFDNVKNDPWDMLNKFCFHVHAQKSLFIGENASSSSSSPYPVSLEFIELVVVPS